MRRLPVIQHINAICLRESLFILLNHASCVGWRRWGNILHVNIEPYHSSPSDHVDPGTRADPKKPHLLNPNVTTRNISPYLGTDISGVQISELTKEGLDELALFAAETSVTRISRILVQIVKLNSQSPSICWLVWVLSYHNLCQALWSLYTFTLPLEISKAIQNFTLVGLYFCAKPLPNVLYYSLSRRWQ